MKTSDMEILFERSFPSHSENSERTVNTHRLFSQASYSLKTDRGLNVILK